jgi:hypothetical protein
MKMSLKYLMLASPLLLTGCTLYPKYKRPDVLWAMPSGGKFFRTRSCRD